MIINDTKIKVFSSINEVHFVIEKKIQFNIEII